MITGLCKSKAFRKTASKPRSYVSIYIQSEDTTLTITGDKSSKTIKLNDLSSKFPTTFDFHVSDIHMIRVTLTREESHVICL